MMTAQMCCLECQQLNDDPPTFDSEFCCQACGAVMIERFEPELDAA